MCVVAVTIEFNVLSNLFPFQSLVCYNVDPLPPIYCKRVVVWSRSGNDPRFLLFSPHWYAVSSLSRSKKELATGDCRMFATKLGISITFHNNYIEGRATNLQSRL